MSPMISRPVSSLKGILQVPGDKSISHRALILSALAVGESRISGLLEAEDVLATLQAIRNLGTEANCLNGVWHISGRGICGLHEPRTILDMGNSGTSTRLLAGIAAAQPFTTFFTGDASLSRRPMARVIEPLSMIGAEFWARSQHRLPFAVRGTDHPVPIDYRLPVPSAQVKSAILLAGLHAPGATTVIEPTPTRDHTERMLSAFGAAVRIQDSQDGERRVTVAGQPELSACTLSIPGDISSAAFLLVAALIAPQANVTLPSVGINPLRCGLIDCLREMGGNITLSNQRLETGEPVADIHIQASPLHGIDVPPERVPSMIDEYPILAVAAACADGATTMHGLSELRVKESDRLTAIAEGLRACGVETKSGPDWLTVVGTGGPIRGDCLIETRSDHRIAMAFLVLGTACQAAVKIDDSSPIATSFPTFLTLMNALGAKIEVP